jgi:hypothetical protein
MDLHVAQRSCAIDVLEQVSPGMQLCTVEDSQFTAAIADIALLTSIIPERGKGFVIFRGVSNAWLRLLRKSGETIQ